MTTTNKFFFLLLITLFTSCYHVPNRIQPSLQYSVDEKVLNQLDSAFPLLTIDEKQEDWGKEYTIAMAFAHDFDLYRAITSFKRAEILLATDDDFRRLSIQYNIIFCYYLAKHYTEAIEVFEKSLLPNTDKSFPAFHDLLVILYECYRTIKDEDKVARIQELLEKSYHATANNLQLSCALSDGNISKVYQVAPHESYVHEILKNYQNQKKSIKQAQFYNALIPGSGYLYIGQKKSALTSFLINALFITAAYEFFHHGYTAAGIITTSFEMGWYFGGIYGAGEEAKYYNERIYEKNIGNMMNGQGLFPIFMLQHTF